MVNLSRRDALKVMGAGGAALVLASASVPKIVEAFPTSNNHSRNDSDSDSKDDSFQNPMINSKDPLIILIEEGQVFAFQDTKEFVKVDDKLAAKLIHDLVGGERNDKS